MMTTFRRGAAWFFLGALTAPLHASPSAIAFGNGGFEYAVPTWRIVNRQDAGAVITETAARAGKFGLTITDNSNDTFACAKSPNLPTAPGRVYQLKSWSRTHSPGTYGGISLRFFDASGRIVGDSPSSHVQATGSIGEWTPFTLTTTAPADAATLSIWIHTYSKQIGTVDFDDIELHEIADDESVSASVAPPPVPDPSSHTSPPGDIAGAKGRYIVIKANGLTVRPDGTVPPRWETFAGFLRDRRLKASIGIITSSLDISNQSYFAWSIDTSKESYFTWIKDRHAGGSIEFWHNGYNHHKWFENGVDVLEFKGSGYPHQRDHLSQGQELARARLGFTFTTFGAPFNGTDADTVRALSEDAGIRVWFYGDKSAPAGKTVLDRDPVVSLEDPAFVPDPEAFASGYAATSDSRRYYVIEAHPARWDDVAFSKFIQVIDFLVAHEARFVTPTELAEILAR